MSTAYYPQTDGQSERANQRVELFLRIYGNNEKNDWVAMLPLAQFAYNSWPNATTGFTPYQLLLGYTPSVHVRARTTDVPNVEQRANWLATLREKAQTALHNAHQIQLR